MGDPQMINVFKDINQVTMRDANVNIQAADNVHGFKVLVTNASPNAFYDSNAESHRDRCHPLTRLATQTVIKDWVMLKKYQDKPVMWLHGPAGAGKTAIGKSIAEWCMKSGQGRLIGKFARQVEGDPHVFSATLEKQIIKLILQPLEAARLSSSAVPYVIIIDGLDECNDHGEQRVVLQTVAALLPTFTCLKFLIISRPDPTIAITFREPGLRAITEPLSLSDDPTSVADIHRYVVEKFADIKSMLIRPPSGEWPSPDDVTLIVEKSSAQFVLAATVYRYVSSPKYLHKATSRLKDVMEVLRNRSNNQDHPLREVDAVYAFILSDDDPKFTANFVGCCLVYPMYFGFVSPSHVQEVLQIEEEQTMEKLGGLASIFEVTDIRTIIPYHASLGDFLFNRSRSGDLLYCDVGEISAKITCSCLPLIRFGNHTLDRNFWNCFLKAFSAARGTHELGLLLSTMDIPWGAMVLHDRDSRFRYLSVENFRDFMVVLKEKVMSNVLLLQENAVHAHFLLFQKFEDSALYPRIATSIDRWFCTALTSFSNSLVHSSAVLGCIGCNQVLSEVHSSYLDGLFQSRHHVDGLWVFMTSGCWNEISPYMPKVRALAVRKRVSATLLCRQAIKSYPSKSTINGLASNLLKSFGIWNKWQS